MSKMMEKMRAKMAQSQKSGNYEKDDFWYPQRDKSGNGSAVIRFVPNKDWATSDDALSWVNYHRHEWKNKAGKWFIEYCPGDKSNPCPVCEANRPFYEEYTKEKARSLVGHRTRKKHFVANVLIIKDPANPENEGTIRLFKFGKTIFDMINDKLNPKFADEEAQNPWDLEEGVSFKFKIHKEDGQTKYSKSGWEDVSDVSDMVDYSQFTELDSFIADEKYKPYDEILKAFNRIEGLSQRSSQDDDDDDDAPAPKRKARDDNDDDDAPARKPMKAPRGNTSDDDDVPAPKRKARDEDDDEVPAPKRKAREDEDEEVPAPKKKPVKTDDDEDDELVRMMQELSGKD